MPTSFYIHSRRKSHQNFIEWSVQRTIVSLPGNLILASPIASTCLVFTANPPTFLWFSWSLLWLIRSFLWQTSQLWLPWHGLPYPLSYPWEFDLVRSPLPCMAHSLCHLWLFGQYFMAHPLAFHDNLVFYGTGFSFSVLFFFFFLFMLHVCHVGKKEYMGIYGEKPHRTYEGLLGFWRQKGSFCCFSVFFCFFFAIWSTSTIGSVTCKIPTFVIFHRKWQVSWYRPSVRVDIDHLFVT